ncbi:MAG: GWxTD domain-containing protein [Cyclobacteriaceae bacterium]|nr:GWxTD domain-containing protein [Cytophagales bacterium]MCZ8329122.1 GWxTD domain-containing protein [Cyclobacteriaceae bacterium]
MKRFFLLLLFPVSAWSQALNSINYQYWYNTDKGFDFSMQKFSNTGDSVQIYFNLQAVESSSIERLSLSFYRFANMSAKEGEQFSPVIHYFANSTTIKNGVFAIKAGTDLVVARVTDIAAKRAWVYFVDTSNEIVPALLALANGNGITKKYAEKGSTISLWPQPKQVIVSYYKENFPAGSPPYAEVQNMVASALKPDSVFVSDGSFTAISNGLYLIQSDTLSKQATAFRIEEDYPKFKKLASLAAPFTYITTKAEYNKIAAAGTDKRLFDRSILAITGDAERAKFLMRNYFKRVELANQFFTSYKEGWKTDRGMIYMVFGLPDAVYRTSASEIWEYAVQGDKVSFTFVRSATLFDPDNYVLIRKKKVEDIWLQAVDLNRNARF